jgi:hypothetical protein
LVWVTNETDLTPELRQAITDHQDTLRILAHAPAPNPELTELLTGLSPGVVDLAIELYNGTPSIGT